MHYKTQNGIRLLASFSYVLVVTMLIGVSSCPFGYQADTEKTISGAVKDENGKAVPDATVSTMPPSTVAKTDETGYYQLNGVKSSIYKLKVSKTGYKTQMIDMGINAIFNCTSFRTKIDVTLYRIITGDIESDGLVYVPGGTFKQVVLSDASRFERLEFFHTISSFYIGQYEVTYDLWYTVYQWAIANGYAFTNAGKEGNDGETGAVPTWTKNEPVTAVSWRDVIVWCNAYSEKTGLSPVYYSDKAFTNPIKNSRDAEYENKFHDGVGTIDDPYANWDADGYRLLTEGEWQYAASYIDGVSWTPSNYASGATKDINDSEATGIVAWYPANAEEKTHEVGKKNPNNLGVYDMSGNISEWCWDPYGTHFDGQNELINFRGDYNFGKRAIRGGSWFRYNWLGDMVMIQVGYRENNRTYSKNGSTGFRLARSL